MNKSKIEKIKHACLRINNEILYIGKSHEDCYKKIPKEIQVKVAEAGFLTNLDRFVLRHEAAEIAFKSNQLPHQPKMLFSEHFWSKMYQGEYLYSNENGYYLI